jgi:hypothetical protein
MFDELCGKFQLFRIHGSRIITRNQNGKVSMVPQGMPMIVLVVFTVSPLTVAFASRLTWFQGRIQPDNQELVCLPYPPPSSHSRPLFAQHA